MLFKCFKKEYLRLKITIRLGCYWTHLFMKRDLRNTRLSRVESLILFLNLVTNKLAELNTLSASIELGLMVNNAWYSFSRWAGLSEVSSKIHISFLRIWSKSFEVTFSISFLVFFLGFRMQSSSSSDSSASVSPTSSKFWTALLKLKGIYLFSESKMWPVNETFQPQNNILVVN